MSTQRDLRAFEERASTYEDGWRGALHHQIAERTATLIQTTVTSPTTVLDVGCGTGYLLRMLAGQSPATAEFSGVDPAANTDDNRITYRSGVAGEELPYPDAIFDLVVSTTSFDHGANQLAGLKECARVLQPSGCLVLVDQFSTLLLPTLLCGRAGKARTQQRCTRFLSNAGFKTAQWHDLYAVIIKAVIAKTEAT